MTLTIYSVLGGMLCLLALVLWFQHRNQAISRDMLNRILQVASIPSYRIAVPQMEKELARARRLESPLSMIVIRPVSRYLHDSEGHQLPVDTNDGKSDTNRPHRMNLLDFMLCGPIFRDAVRSVDLTTYDGGKNQYVILLPESNRQQAVSMVHRLRTIIGDPVFTRLHIEIAEFPEDGLFMQDLIGHATHITGSETATFGTKQTESLFEDSDAMLEK